MSAGAPDELKRITVEVTVRMVGCPSCGGVAPLTATADAGEPWGVLVVCQLCGERIEWGHIVDVVDWATSDITVINGETGM